MSSLANQHCVPCRGGVPPLEGEPLEKLSAQLYDRAPPLDSAYPKVIVTKRTQADSSTRSRLRYEPELNPPGGRGQFQQPSTDKLTETLDLHVEKARESLSNTNDEFLMTTNWRLKAGGKVVMEQPRHIVLRDTVFNHLAHHRGQLTVYLRLNGAPVPAIYGPTADDKQFG